MKFGRNIIVLALLLQALPALALEISSVRLDSSAQQSNIAVRLNEIPEFSDINLQAVGDGVELVINGATFADDMRSDLSAHSDVVEKLEYNSTSSKAIVRLKTQLNPQDVLHASKIGKYHDEILLTIDHRPLKIGENAATATNLGEAYFMPIGIIAAVFVLLLAAVQLGKRRRAPSNVPFVHKNAPKIQLETLAHIPQANTPQLAMLQVGNQKLLIANGPTGIQLLTAFPLSSKPTLPMTGGADELIKQELIDKLREQIRNKKNEMIMRSTKL